MKSKKGGFTLVEILIAMVIISVGMGCLMATFSVGMKGMATSKDKVIAVNLARALMDEIIGKNFTHDKRESNRSLYDDVEDYAFWGPNDPPLNCLGELLDQYAGFARSARVCYVSISDLNQKVEGPTPFKKVIVRVEHEDIPPVVLIALKTSEIYVTVKRGKSRRN